MTQPLPANQVPVNQVPVNQVPVNQVLLGDCVAHMNALPEKCVDLVFADPPYNLQLQGELWRPNMTRVDAVTDPWDKFNSFAEYDAFTRAWLLAARRVLKDTGALWVMGSYHSVYRIGSVLQDLGFWILNDIAWVKCLSETTSVYVRDADGHSRPVIIKDLIRGDVQKYSLWNGETWSRICGWRASQQSDGLEIHLRSGEKLRCTRDHRWPTGRGLVSAADLIVGDVLARTQLPEPVQADRVRLDDELSGWFVGLYIAEGSRHQGSINIASHVKEKDRFQRLREVAEAFHGQCRWYDLQGKSATIAMHGPILNGLIDTYVSGRTSKNKHLSPCCWERSNTFLRAVLVGYLEGDGHYDKVNDRWRLGFAQNRELEVSLRTLAARLGVQIQIKDARGRYNHENYPLLRGEVRWARPNSPWARHDTEVVSIKTTTSTHFVDLSVEDEPHLFALASGVLTHNSNPTPQMKGTRFCNAHDTLIWAKKSEKQAKYTFHYKALKAGNEDKQLRSDWHLPICNGKERETVNGRKAHTTQKPESLLHRVLAATTNPGDLVLDPFAGTGTTAAVAKKLGRDYLTIDREAQYVAVARRRLAAVTPSLLGDEGVFVDAPKPRVPFLSFVESGALPAGTRLRLKGAQTTALVHPDGSITAAGHRGSIHKVGALLLGLPTCNGWTAWLFPDPATGADRPLDDLRG